MAVRDTDKGMRALFAQLGAANGSYTKVGIQRGARRKPAPGDSSTDMVAVAMANEFGVPEKNIPARSFIRSTADETRQTSTRLLAAEAEKIIAGKSTPRRSLALIGEWMQGRIVKKIGSNIGPANAPSTLRRKMHLGYKGEARAHGVANFIGPVRVTTLIDSGQMRGAVRHVEVIRGEGRRK